MAVWKNGRKPPFADSKEDLNIEMIHKYVRCLTLEGLQTATCCFILYAQKTALTPEQITNLIETKKSNPVRFTPELDLQ